MNAALKELIAAVVKDADAVGWYRPSLEALAEFAKTEYDPIMVMIRDNKVEEVYNLPFGCSVVVTIDVSGLHSRTKFEGE